MPDPETCAREQDAVLWPFLRADSRGGPVLSDPVPLLASEGQGVRWKYQQTEMLDPKRASVLVDATVVVDRDVPIDSLIWLGRLQDLVGADGPLDGTPSGLHQVKAFTHTPSHDARATYRKLGVVRFRGKLPQGRG